MCATTNLRALKKGSASRPGCDLYKLADEQKVFGRAYVIVAFAVLYLTWGSTFLGIRLAIQSIPPGIMAGMRSIVAGTLVYSFLRVRGGVSRPSARDWRIALLLGAGIISVGNGSLTYSERFIPSGTAAVILAPMPAMMAVMGWFAGITEKPPAAVWIGIILATCGVAIVVHPGGLTASREQLWSVGLLLAGETIWSATSLYAGRVRQNCSPFMMASMQMLCSGALMLSFALVHGEFTEFNVKSVTMRSVAAMAYLTLTGSVIGYLAYIWLLRNLEATRVATHAYVCPVLALLLGWIVAGERLAADLLTGAFW